MKAKITTRTCPCRCGCHGSDPWHRRDMTREVREFVAVEPIANQGDTAKAVITGRGVARFPWGLEAVVREVWSFDGKIQRVADWRLETLKR